MPGAGVIVPVPVSAVRMLMPAVRMLMPAVRTVMGVGHGFERYCNHLVKATIPR